MKNHQIRSRCHYNQGLRIRTYDLLGRNPKFLSKTKTNLTGLKTIRLAQFQCLYDRRQEDQVEI